MRKIFKQIVYLVFLLTIFTSCEKQLLDKKPLDIITDNAVWSDPALIDAYVVNLYSRVPTWGLFKYFVWTWPNIYTPNMETTVTDESRSIHGWTPEVTKWNQGLLDGTGGMLEYWDYLLIRACNKFFELIETSNIAADVKLQYIAEVRFLRAFVYFEMVKRYGGVPLITVAQKITDGDALFVTRNKEKEIYDFIASECDDIIELLPEGYTNKGLGRAYKYSALALKSRAMLYAASIAKYGTVQPDGIVGIPASEADSYWLASLNASKAIMDSEKFQLFNEYPTDKAENYRMLFLEEDNSEVIWARKYVSLVLGHSYDWLAAPATFGPGWGSMTNPTLEMVDSYEMIDGSSGIDWANARGSVPEILKNKEPRFHATIFYNNMFWQDDTVQTYNGILVDANGDGTKELITTQFYQGMRAQGKDQSGSTGFVLKKYVENRQKQIKTDESGQDWIVFRFGEILLNYAEAAFELGFTSEALTAVNQIRERAGVPLLTTINLEQIRHERQIELAFETHRLWDLKRWRSAVDILTGDFHGVLTYYDWDAKEYYFEVNNCDGYSRIFKPEHYYLPITAARIDNNPNLKENPGY